jgi:hypothetical protein
MGAAGVIPTFVVAGLLHALPAAAQRFSFAPEIGVYIPTEKLIDASNGTQVRLGFGIPFGGGGMLGLGR